MWTHESDEELRSLGSAAFAGKYNVPFEEVRAHYLNIVDPAGQAALLREKNKAIEAEFWLKALNTLPKKTSPKSPEDVSDLSPNTLKTFPNPWPAEDVEKLRNLFNAGMSDSEIAERLGKTEKAIHAKRCRVGLLRQINHNV